MTLEVVWGLGLQWWNKWGMPYCLWKQRAGFLASAWLVHHFPVTITMSHVNVESSQNTQLPLEGGRSLDHARRLNVLELIPYLKIIPVACDVAANAIFALCKFWLAKFAPALNLLPWLQLDIVGTEVWAKKILNLGRAAVCSISVRTAVLWAAFPDTLQSHRLEVGLPIEGQAPMFLLPEGC